MLLLLYLEAIAWCFSTVVEVIEGVCCTRVVQREVVMCLQAAEWAATKPPLGEYTIVVEGVQSLAMPSAVQDSHGEPTLEEDVSQAMLLVYMLVAEGVKVPIAIKRAAAVTGVQRSILYNAVLKRKDDTS